MEDCSVAVCVRPKPFLSGSILNDADRTAIRQRIGSVTSASVPRWGWMDATAMLTHLRQSALMALGELPVACKSERVFQVFPINHLILHVVPFPKSAPTALELLVSKAEPLDAPRLRLVSLVERIGAGPHEGNGLGPAVVPGVGRGDVQAHGPSSSVVWGTEYDAVEPVHAPDKVATTLIGPGRFWTAALQVMRGRYADLPSMKRQILTLFLLLWAPIASHGESCGNFPAPGFDAPENRHFVGEYRNPNYGFAVTIPKGFTGHDAPDPAPHHGFGVVLSWEPRVYIDFDGSYNANDLSLRATEERNLGYLRQDSASVQSVSSRAFKLGPLPARRQVVYHTCAGHQGVSVDDQVIALSRDKSITYTAWLMTTTSRYEKDLKLFEKFLRTWKLSSIE